MVEYESGKGFRLSKLAFFVILFDFIAFSKPFAAKCPPVRFVFGKKHVTIFFEQVLT